jgi:hypothetical protein
MSLHTNLVAEAHLAGLVVHVLETMEKFIKLWLQTQITHDIQNGQATL